MLSNYKFFFMGNFQLQVVIDKIHEMVSQLAGIL